MKKIISILIMFVLLINCITFYSTKENEETYRTIPKIYYCFFVQEIYTFYCFFIYQEKNTKIVYPGYSILIPNKNTLKTIISGYYDLKLEICYNKDSEEIRKIDFIWNHSIKKIEIEPIIVETMEDMINYLNKKKNIKI